MYCYYIYLLAEY